MLRDPTASILALTALFAACSTDSESLAASTETGANPGEAGTGGSTGASVDQAGEDAGTGDVDDGEGTLESEDIDWDAELGIIFPQDHVVDIVIAPPPGDWDALLSQWDEASSKVWYATRLQYDDDVLNPVGMRLKGWSTLLYGTGYGGGPAAPGNSDPAGKFPLKIDFDRYEGPHYHNLDRVALNNNWADISYMRTRLASRMYESMGVPSSSTAYGRATVDGRDAGLYTIVQPIDRPFLRSRFGSANHANDGNLYKIVYSDTEIGSLVWRGDAKEDYVSTTHCKGGTLECGILLKTNTEDENANDYEDLISFIDVLNHSADAEFSEKIDARFDVDSFLRQAAVNVAISSFDNYFGMGHNYYLYRRPTDDRFIMIPWDLNETYAGHPCGEDMLRYDVHDPVCNQRGHDFVLARRILAVPAFRQAYLGYVEEVASQWLTPEVHRTWVSEFEYLIRDHIATDPNYIAELSDWLTAIGDAPPSGENLGGHGGVEYNLLDFVTRRSAAILSQL
ncbi:MAG: CotH kinase family protein [Nannocystaceae bacterium]